MEPSYLSHLKLSRQKRGIMADDIVAKLYYEAIKFYELPVLNHTVIKKKIKDMEAEIGQEHAVHYLRALVRRNLRREHFDFQPTLNSGLDIYAKRVLIEGYYRRNEPRKAYKAPSPEVAAQQEADRQKQWDK